MSFPSAGDRKYLEMLDATLQQLARLEKRIVEIELAHQAQLELLKQLGENFRRLVFDLEVRGHVPPNKGRKF